MIKRKEMIVIMFLVLIALILLGAHFFMSGDQNDKALRVTQNDRVIMTIPLHKDTEEKIVDGDHYNIIVIKEGKAFVQETNCKNQICVHTKAIADIGESIACLPHHLILEIVPKGEN